MNRSTPPRWADRFLEWYCDPAILEDLQGDLHERFNMRKESIGSFRAKLLFIWDVMFFLRPHTLKNSYGRTSLLFMVMHYLTSSFRNLFRNKLITCLSIFGLAISITTLLMISLYVGDELKYDRHYDKVDRIYQVTSEVKSITSNSLIGWTDGFLGQRLKETYQEVEETVEMVKLPGKTTLNYGNYIFPEERLYIAERTYFRIFSHKWLAGNPNTALSFPKQVVLTQYLAEKYFDKTDPLNKVISIGGDNYTVTGVIENLPEQTDLKFDALLSSEKEHLAETSYWCITYILFRDKGAALGFDSKIYEVSRQQLHGEVAGMDATLLYHMTPLTDVHFGQTKRFDTPKSNRNNAYIFSLVAFIILLLACINYANLSTALVIKRRAEASIRKIIGATSFHLANQYLVESILTFFISVVLAFALTVVGLPFLNQITNKHIFFTELINFQSISIFLILLTMLGVLAGIYPAFLLSSVKTMQVLNSHDSVKNKNRFRRALIVFQFVISIGLIICSQIVYEQWNLLTKMSPGFTKDQVLVIDIPREDSVRTLLSSIKNQYTALPFVKNSSLVGYNSLPTSSMDVDDYETEYEGKNTTQIFNNITVDENYFELLEIDFIEGTNFKDDEMAENSVVVNESLVKLMNWGNPLNQTFYRNSEAYDVVGVIKDFHFNSLHKMIEPIIIHSHPRRPEKLIVKVDKVDYESIQQLESIWKASNEYPFEANFLNSYVYEQYKNENTMRDVLKWFSAFTLIIACLGLFGLVAVFTTQKTKEFGIRKILGAQHQNIAFLVMKEFVWLVLLGAIVALPLAWWSMEQWLKQFPYKITFELIDFLWPVAITFIAAVLSMSYHAIRASYVNPVKSIKES